MLHPVNGRERRYPVNLPHRLCRPDARLRGGIEAGVDRQGANGSAFRARDRLAPRGSQDSPNTAGSEMQNLKAARDRLLKPAITYGIATSVSDNQWVIADESFGGQAPPHCATRQSRPNVSVCQRGGSKGWKDTSPLLLHCARMRTLASPEGRFLCIVTTARQILVFCNVCNIAALSELADAAIPGSAMATAPDPERAHNPSHQACLPQRLSPLPRSV